MKRAVIRLGTTVFLATVLLAVLVITVPGRRGLFAGIYVLVLGALGLAALVRSFRPLAPRPSARSPFERVPEAREAASPVTELDRIDRLVVLGSGNSFDLHYRLRPLLRELAAERLHAGYGVELDREPERARPLLGDELWEVVRPGLELAQRFGPGLPPAALERLVGRLEAL